MSFKLKMRAATGLPAGAYEGEFIGVDTVEDNGNGYGSGLKWSWRITRGESVGKTASRITGASPSLRNACGKMLNAIAGKTLADGDEFEPSDYIGRKYTVIVQAGDTGGTRVETVAPMPGAGA